MLKTVSNFPSSKTVSVKVIDNTGTVHQDWDNSIVTEISIAGGRSVYHADLSVITSAFKGFIFWKTDDATPLVAAEALNVYAVIGFASGKTVYFKTVNSAGTTIDDWSNTDVTEYLIDSTAARSVYMANPPGITVDFSGVLLWKDNSATPLTASQVIRGISEIPTTTSGSYDFNATLIEIITAAYRIIGRLAEGESLGAALYEIGKHALNAMKRTWQNPPINLGLWEERWVTKTFSASSSVNGSDGSVYTCILSHVSSSDNKPVTGSNYTTNWYKTGTSGSAWVSGGSYSCNSDFDLSEDILSISKAFIRFNYIDYPVDIINMPQYFDIYDKRIQSIPSLLIYEKKLTPHVYLWPQLDRTDYVLHYLATYKLQDFDNPDDNPDFLSGWIEALEWNLALRLCSQYGIVGQKRAEIRELAKESLMSARLGNNYINYDNFISPSFRV